MEHSLFVEQNILKSYLQDRNYNQEFFWPKFLTVEYSPTLTWETLVGVVGAPIAANIISYNSSAPEQARRIISKLQGEIPKISSCRTLDEKGINKLNAIKNSNVGTEIINFVFNDVDFVAFAINSRIEWLFGQAVSRGAVTLCKTVNAGIITLNDIDFQIPSANKTVMSADNRKWTIANAATALPITDISDACTAAREDGVKLRYILMNSSKFVAFRSNAEVKDYIYGVMLAESGLAPGIVPTQKAINTVLKESGYPEIIILDSIVNLEDEDHTITAKDIWLDSAGADRYVTLIPDLKIGRLVHGPQAIETNPPKQITAFKKDFMFIYKFSDVNPVVETTIGEANAFICLDRCLEMYIIDTESHTTFGA